VRRFIAIAISAVAIKRVEVKEVKQLMDTGINEGIYS
jgi:hypothetical protein